MQTLSWLHFSDFHQGIGSQGWLWPTVKDQFFRDLAALHETTGPWDLILFTGDLTNRAAAEEFTALDVTLGHLLARLGRLGSHPVLLAVPGNHDLVRPDPLSPEVKGLSDWHSDRKLREAFWSAAGSGREYRETIEQAFANYTNWYDAWWEAHPAPPGLSVKRTKGTLPGDFAASVSKEGLLLGVVGLNSAFLHLTDGNQKGKLDLDPRQLKGCGDDPPAWLRQHHATLLLTHHPVDWLNKKHAQARYNTTIAPPGLFTAHLFGHMHDAATHAVSSGGFASYRLLQASSLFGLETWGNEEERSHGYAAGRIEVDGAAGVLRIWPRAMRRTREGFLELGADPDFKLDRTGALALPFGPHPSLPPPALTRPAPAAPPSSAPVRPAPAAPPSSNPEIQPPRAAYNPRWYVDRDAKHRDALHYLWTPGKPVVLWGPTAAGKTWLMKHVLDLACRQNDTCLLVDLNLQLFRPAMTSLNGLLGTVARHIAQKLKIDREAVTHEWKSDDPATLKLTWLMEERFLSQDNALVVLAMDQIDEILGLPITDDFFGMLRSWAELANQPRWSSLRIAIAASTIKLTQDVNKSPFRGLSEPIEIDDFEVAQVDALAMRHKLGWHASEITALMNLVGGHPYLLRCAMYQAAVHGKKLDEILAPQSTTFEAHLEDCRRRLPSDPGTLEALGAMKHGRTVVLPEGADEALLRLGVVALEGRNRYRLRYRLYERL